MDVSIIKDCFINDKVLYSKHALYEMQNEEYGIITEDEVYQIIINGEIITNYENDKPYPSYLIFGMTEKNRPLHVVAAYDKEDDIVIIITIYHPDPNLWIDYKERRK